MPLGKDDNPRNFRRPLMAKKDQLYVAKTSGTMEIDGVPYFFEKGKTRVREGHPITKRDGFENLFELVDDNVTYDVEQATAAPGEKRGEKK
jgi:hypothetical protein